METTATPAGLNLQKNERGLVLDKDGGQLKKIHMGAGWDVNAPNAKTYDLDLFAICLGEGSKLVGGPSHNNIAYFGNKTLPGIQCGADNLTGQGDGDDENIQIDLDAVPANVHAIVIGINIYQAAAKNQNMGAVNNAFVRYAPQDNRPATVKKYDLTEDYSTFTGIVAFKFYRHEDGWKFQAVGQGVNGDINQIASTFA